MADNSMVITIVARDQATQVLQNVRQEMKLFGPSGETLVDFGKRTENVNQNLLNLDAGAGRAARSVRSLALPLASELSPALGVTSAQIVNVVQSATLLGSRMGALTLGAVGLAAIVGGRLLESWQANKDAMRDFDRAMGSVDLGRITGQVQNLRLELEKTDQRIKELGAARGGLGPGFGPLDVILGESVFDLRSARARREQQFQNLEEGARRQQSFTQGRRASEFTRAENELDTLEGPEAAGLDIRRRIRDLQKQVAEVGILDPIERQFQTALREAQTVLDQPGGGAEQRRLAEGLVRLARARRQQALDERRLAFQARPIEGVEEVERFEGLAPGIEVPASQVEAGRKQIFESERREFVGREAAPEPGIEDVARFEALAPGVRDQASEAAVERGRKAVSDVDLQSQIRSVELKRESLQVDQQIVELEGQRVGLTQRQRDALELSISSQREQLKLADLTLQRDMEQLPAAQALIDRKKELVTAQEALFRSSVEQRRLEREDPIAGLAAGQREIDESAAAAGDRLRTAYVSAYHDISQGFSDIVVDGLTNQGDKIGDIGKQMGKRLLAGFVDQISSQLFSRVFSGLGQVFGVPSTSAARPLATAIPLLASPFAAASTAGAATGTATVVQQAGGAGGLLGSQYLQAATGGNAASPATFSPGVATQAAATTGSGIGILGQGIGIAQQALSGFFGPQLSVGGVLAAYNAGGLAGIATAQALVGAGISETTAAAIVAQEAIGLGAVEGGAAASTTGVSGTAAGGAGAAAASAAGAVLAAAALAYSAYSAYQSGDVVGGAISGGVSGAALGASIGSIFPVVGTVVGAVVGLVVGAAIGAGAGKAGKDEQEVKGDRARNEADRQRRGAWIYQDLMKAINTGIDHEDIALQNVRTGHSVGQLLCGVASLNRNGILNQQPWYWPPSENALKTREILIKLGYLPLLTFEWDRINSTAELIATWHNPRGITEGDIEIAKNAEALMAAFASKQGSTILIGYEEEGDTGLRGAAGALTRTTLLTSNRAREAEGQDLFVVGGSTRGLDDAQLGRLINRLLKLDADQSIDTRQIESDGGAYVTTETTTAGADVEAAPQARPDLPASQTSQLLPPPPAPLVAPTPVATLPPELQPFGSDLTTTEAQQQLAPVMASASQFVLPTDDETQRLLEQMAKVDRNRDLRILNIESVVGATVTIGA